MRPRIRITNAQGLVVISMPVALLLATRFCIYNPGEILLLTVTGDDEKETSWRFVMPQLDPDA